jgi:DNA-binding beta-propeller fold protein YncE
MSRARARTISAVTASVAVGAVLAGQAMAAGGRLPHVTPYSPTGTYAEGSSLPSGRLVDPVGRRTKTDDFPVAIAVSPDGRTAVLSNSGQGSGAPEQGDQSLQVVDLRSGKVVQTVRDHEAGSITFYNAGLGFSRDGRHLYATGGGNDQVYDYAVSGQRLRLKARWSSSQRHPLSAGVRRTPLNGYLGNAFAYSRGLAVQPDGSAVVVTNEQGSTVAALSTKDGSLLWETPLGGPAVAGGAYPGAVVLSADGSRAYVTAQGLNAVATVETTAGALVGLTPVGDHPVAVTRVGSTLLVANANDDSLSIVDTTSSLPQQAAQLSTHLVAGESNGSTPDAVAADPARGLVYVALANDNAVMVLRAAKSSGRFDFTTLTPAGFLPTGWYPTAVAVRGDGALLAAAAKGLGGAPITTHKQYIVNKRNGVLTTTPSPSAQDLRSGTAKARAFLLHPTRSNALRPKDSPIPTEATKGQSPIKHVVLVVRENRTFDQVFGDLKRKGADVEPKYLEFGQRDKQGRTITPNIHALANRFALSQNFYSDGEASIQGHHWMAEGISTDYTEKSYLHNYSDRNHPYDPVFGITYPRCGAVFQQLARQGKSFRNFGELVGLATAQAPTVQPAPGAACATPGGAYDAVSVASFSNVFGGNLSITAVNDTDKVKDITAELDPMIAAGRMPQFTMVFLGNDHTDGTKSGSKTPQAHVATNDLAVGQLVDHLSHSASWPSTAVFVVEDDSQDGLDHRDGHRNVLLVASPYARRGGLSSLHLSQASVLRAIELILGIDPLSSYTQYAAVPYDLFQAKPDLTPYTAVTPTYPLDAKNGAAASGTAASVPLDLSTFDVAGPVLEAQLWEATRPGEPMPAALLAMLRLRGGIRGEALAAWAKGEPCLCRPLRDGLLVAPGGDTDG